MKTRRLKTAGEEKMRVGSLASLSQLTASGLPQMIFFQTSVPSAAFRQYIVLPPAKYTFPSTTAAEDVMSPPSVWARSCGALGPPGHWAGMGCTVLWQRSEEHTSELQS